MHLVVAFRADGNHLRGATRRRTDGGSEFADTGGAGDALRVHDACGDQLAGNLGVGEHAGDDERAEEVALAAFVDAEVGFELVRLQHLLVAESGLAKHFGFEREAHEVLSALALHQHLRAFLIDRYIELALAGGEERVGLRFEVISLA